MVLKNSDVKKRCKTEIESNNEKIYSRIRSTVSNKIEFTAYGLHRDQPPAWEVKVKVMSVVGRRRVNFVTIGISHWS